jgi:hypothetical protein
MHHHFQKSEPKRFHIQHQLVHVQEVKIRVCLKNIKVTPINNATTKTMVRHIQATLKQ